MLAPEFWMPLDEATCMKERFQTENSLMQSPVFSGAPCKVRTVVLLERWSLCLLSGPIKCLNLPTSEVSPGLGHVGFHPPVCKHDIHFACTPTERVDSPFISHVMSCSLGITLKHLYRVCVF